MSKSHRDNVKARKHRGAVAYAKRTARRTAEPKCRICGTVAREKVFTERVCPRCLERTNGTPSTAV